MWTRENTGCAVSPLPVQHLCNFSEAAKGQEDENGLGFLVDLRGAKVIDPAAQHVRTLLRAQADLWDTAEMSHSPLPHTQRALWADARATETIILK